MPPAGFEPAIPANERLQTHVLDRAATGIGSKVIIQSDQKLCAPDDYNTEITSNVQSVPRLSPDIY